MYFGIYMMFFLSRFIYFFIIVLIIANIVNNSYAEEPELTAAHKLLVKKNHLGNLETPIKLKYIYKKKGSLEANFSDRVVMIVPNKDSEGYHNIKFDFFSGYNKEDLKSARYKSTNPIFHAFWEHDIKVMTRLTEGSVIYFRKRITWSLSDENKFNIKPATCAYNDKKFDGHKIEHVPYEQDYDSKNFAKFAKKKYYITLCEDIPGMIYEIETIIPSENGQEPLLQETLTLQKIIN